MGATTIDRLRIDPEERRLCLNDLNRGTNGVK